MTSLCDLLSLNVSLRPDRVSHRWRGPAGPEERTWRQVEDDVTVLALGFEDLGLEGPVALFADNRYEWALSDQALLHLGLPSVPRGSDTPPREQKFLLEHSGSRWLIVESWAQWQTLRQEFGATAPGLRAVLLMDGPADGPRAPGAESTRVLTFAQVREAGRRRHREHPDPLPRWRSGVNSATVASIIYTSGTSGNPKGVVLTHGNFLHNVRAISPLLQADPDADENAVAILPVWHVYERAFEFCCAACGIRLFYSSVRTFTDDLVRERPTLVASVPRVWESIYERIRDRVAKQAALRRAVVATLTAALRARWRAGLRLRGWIPSLRRRAFWWARAPLDALVWLLLGPVALAGRQVLAPVRALLGGRLRASFSGGGSLPPAIDLFFNAVGVTLVNAYGMTESAPGAITRRLDRNVPGTIGIPLDEVEVRVVREDGGLAARGEKGRLQVRGPNVMREYYRNPQATTEVLSADGWLDTGDLGALTWSGDYVITGRAKSTIVLVGGENVEPEPIEQKLQESDLINHAVVVGQDRKSLRAIVTVNEDQLRRLVRRLKWGWDDLWAQDSDVLTHPPLLTLLKAEMKRLVNRDNGFRPFEAITGFVALKRQFLVGEELTQTLKVRRGLVEERYGRLLDGAPEEPLRR